MSGLEEVVLGSIGNQTDGSAEMYPVEMNLSSALNTLMQSSLTPTAHIDANGNGWKKTTKDIFKYPIMKNMKPIEERRYDVTMKKSSSNNLPETFDWRRQHGACIHPVLNQGQCGSCWAFSATAAMEGEFNRRNNGSLPSTCISKCGKMNNTCCSFSNQEVADCTRGGADTCNIGGEPHDGILFVAKTNKGQINTDEQYPYSSGTSGKLTKCTPQTSNAITTGVTGYANVTSGDEEALKQAAYK